MNPSETLETESTPPGLRRQDRARPALLDSAASASWKFLAVAAAGAVVLFALVELRVVVFPVIAAIFLSTLIHPVVTLLQRRGLPRLPSVALAMAGALGLLVGLAALLAPQVANEFGTLSEDVRSGSRQVIQWLSRGPLELTRTELDRYLDRALGELETNSSTITSGVLAGAVSLGEVVVGIILPLVLTFFSVKDGPAMFSGLTSHFEEHRR